MIYFKKEDFSKAILYTRTMREQTLKDVSKATGISQTTIKCIEDGRKPSLEHYYALCRWLQVDLNKYFYVKNEPKGLSSGEV